MSKEEVQEVFESPVREPSKNRSPLKPSDIDYTEFDYDSIYVTIAFDPGGTTGWALLAVFYEAVTSKNFKILDNVAFWSRGQFIGPEEEQAEQMLSLVTAWPDANIVIEDFILRQLAGGREMLAPERITAMFRFGLHTRDPERYYIKQAPSLAIQSMNDDRLKAAGFYEKTAGMPHARDAVRHALTWTRRAADILTINSSGDRT